MKSHEYVPFGDYCKAPERYDEKMCEIHKKPISMTCQDCDVLVCIECDLTDDCVETG